MDKPVTDRISDDRSGSSEAGAYRVLARKYRPSNFGDLVGQDALVRTLKNAITSGRIAQGYMLTGVRGVGKTTTARIIAKALNCVGLDGKGGPTPEPCGVCVNCTAIAEDRHVDVLEMDAASRTGIDDIRELLEGVRYRPVSARFKIYIVDEVHMLSDKAFNALLKTLEEPPEHVKFVFATTEIRKVPVTVLSRCQRFDLRRIDSEKLQGLFGEVSKMEGAKVDGGALSLIARAADGSARDGLSILDQAISQAAGQVVTEEAVRDMLGLADRVMVFDLLEAIMRGDVKASLGLLGNQYAAGASPVVVIQDLLELVHWLTRLKVAPEGAADPALAEAERKRGSTMADALGMAVLTRAWQMLLKGLGEVRSAPMPLQAAEMVLVRMAYAADLPSPADALKTLESGVQVAVRAPASTPPPPRATTQGSVARAVVPDTVPATETTALAAPQTFAEVVALFEKERLAKLATLLRHNVHLVRFDKGVLEFAADKNVPKEAPNQIAKHLREWTGQTWMVSMTNAVGQPTLDEQERERVTSDPFVKSLLDAFPGATISAIRHVDKSSEKK